MPKSVAQLTQDQFEDEVRQVARLLWSEAALGGSLELQGRERDGVFETRDTTHIVEATVSTKKDKADEDAKKTANTVQAIRRTGPRSAQGWLVTQHEPTVDQKKTVDKYSHSVRILSFDQFRSLLFNGSEYIRCRERHSFGSISDPLTRQPMLERGAYIPLDLLSNKHDLSGNSKAVFDRMQSRPLRAVFLGDFGAGKSMTLRDIYFRSADSYRDLKTARVPIYLNLREHRGQTNPVEALERHARQIGYTGGASDLVRIWRAGYVDLWLDGFDEIATSGWGQSLSRVREHRYAAMALVRQFVKETPKSGSVLLAGRSNFFDSSREMTRALGIDDDWYQFSLNDFTPPQVERLLSKLGYRHGIPDWLPSRPLLVAYFAFLGKTGEIHGQFVGLTAGAGWDLFLDRISEREALQDERLDPRTVRQIIERLATKARRTTDGMGRLTMEAVQEAYREVVGSLPDEGGQQLLLRLPGLAPSSAEDGTRSFIDTQFASAARCGDVLRFIEAPFTFDIDVFREVQSGVGLSAKEIFEFKRDNSQISDGALKASLENIVAKRHTGQLAMDVVACAIFSGDGRLIPGITVADAVEDRLVIGDDDLSKIIFDSCIIEEVVLEENSQRNNLPSLVSCIVGTVQGLGNGENLPTQMSSSDVSTIVSGTETNAEIMDLTLSDPTKVLLTILKKLFIQRGGGRQVSAFSRGLDPRAAKFVPDVLDIVLKEGLAQPTQLRGREVWHPNRAQTGRVRQLLAAPLLSSDPLLREAAKL